MVKPIQPTRHCLVGFSYGILQGKEDRFPKGNYSPREIKPIYPVGFSPREIISLFKKHPRQTKMNRKK